MTVPATSNTGETVAPRSAWLGVLRDTTVEIFSLMVGADVAIPEPGSCAMVAYVTGVIGITGAVQATFTLRCSDQSANKAAAQMLGSSLEEAVTQNAMLSEKSATWLRASLNTRSDTAALAT
jgi:CheY-specific phosphatase CheX